MAQPADEPVTVFAAASLKTALDDIAAAFDPEGTALRLSYGGSSTLARQIQYGAQADIFMSANAAWMDMLQDRDLIETTSRRDLLGNRLVLIAEADRATELDLQTEDDIGRALNGGRLAMALVDAVPAGLYGRAALQSLGTWDAVAPMVAQTDNVRAALLLVARGEAPLGIVYETDARSEPRVRVVAVFPAETHPPIRYPVALTREARAPARGFLDFLSGPEAATIFKAHGFDSLGDVR